MSFFDYYEPLPKRYCPECFARLTDWQSENEGHFFLWRQGVSIPVNQMVEDEIKCSIEYRNRQRLPETFNFQTECQRCDSLIKAEGVTVNGVWRYTLIRHPKIVYPSGAEHSLFGINFLIQALAKRLGKDLIVYEEDGLGTWRMFTHDLGFGPTIIVNQSDHLVDKDAFKERAHLGPTIYVDAYDAIKFGFDKLYWGAILALGVSETNVVLNDSYAEYFEECARKQIWKD